MKLKKAIRICVLMAILIALLGVLGPYLSHRLQDNWAFMGMGVGVTVISFFGLLVLCQTNEERWKITADTMRTAIAGTIVIVYLVLVGTVAFISKGKMAEITRTMITNFTAIVGIVIAFYFGSSAYIQAQREKQENKRAKSDE